MIYGQKLENPDSVIKKERLGVAAGQATDVYRNDILSLLSP